MSPVRKLARTGSSVGLVFQICEWQLMQVLVGGILAKLEVSTVVWQYRQSMPMAADVVRMAERHGLLARLGGARFVIGAVQLGERPRQETQDENRAEDSDSREGIGAVMKDLGHGLKGGPLRVSEPASQGLDGFQQFVFLHGIQTAATKTNQ